MEGGSSAYSSGEPCPPWERAGLFCINISCPVLQESGESYLEKAEKMYSQMYSTREKVRAAPKRGSRVLRVRIPRGSLSPAEAAFRALREAMGWNDPWNSPMV